MKNLLLILLTIFVVLSCTSKKTTADTEAESASEELYSNNFIEAFSDTIDDNAYQLFILRNKNGMEVSLTNFGARIVNIYTADKEGDFKDVVVGYGSLEDFMNKPEHFFGATIGRYGNRIGNASFSLDGKEYNLDANNNGNTLHGGVDGFHRKYWAADASNQSVTFSYTSPDGEMGFPGTVDAQVTYTLTDDNELKIEYNASTDQPTVVNLTNHTYFNLAGTGGTINNHLLQLNADFFSEVDDELIPTGNMISVVGTPFDFKERTQIGARLEEESVQLGFGAGYDHNFIIKSEASDSLIKHGELFDPSTGRLMEIFSTEPGMQFYGGNFMTGADTGKYGEAFEHREALCLETQHFPDSPNKPDFPSTRLNPGEKYYTITIYKFSVE